MLYSQFMDSDRVLRIGELSKRSGVSRSCCARGSAVMGSFAPSARPAACASTRPRTSSACVSCASTSRTAWPPPRRRRSRCGPGSATERHRWRCAPRRCGTISPRRSTGTTSHGRRRSSTGCSPWRPWTRLSEVVLPYLRELGERWLRGDASVAQEHFASSVLRGRLLGLARGWGLGLGPTAVLACLPGEQATSA